MAGKRVHRTHPGLKLDLVRRETRHLDCVDASEGSRAEVDCYQVENFEYTILCCRRCAIRLAVAILEAEVG